MARDNLRGRNWLPLPSPERNGVSPSGALLSLSLFPASPDNRWDTITNLSHKQKIRTAVAEFSQRGLIRLRAWNMLLSGFNTCQPESAKPMFISMLHALLVLPPAAIIGIFLLCHSRYLCVRLASSNELPLQMMPEVFWLGFDGRSSFRLDEHNSLHVIYYSPNFMLKSEPWMSCIVTVVAKKVLRFESLSPRRVGIGSQCQSV